jgi:hypothetical protein
VRPRVLPGLDWPNRTRVAPLTRHHLNAAVPLLSHDGYGNC